MKAFILALRLWMMRTRVQEVNSQSQQPDAEASVMTPEAGTPGWSVIAGDRLR
ncbi:hypothetical protein D3C83_163770 [compost metagenome]